MTCPHGVNVGDRVRHKAAGWEDTVMAVTVLTVSGVTWLELEGRAGSWYAPEFDVVGPRLRLRECLAWLRAQPGYYLEESGLRAPAGRFRAGITGNAKLIAYGPTRTSAIRKLQRLVNGAA